MEAVPVFRAPRKRKITQASQQSHEKTTNQQDEVQEATSGAHEGEEGKILRDVVRASKSRRMPKSGMQFSNTIVRDSEGDSPLTVVPVDSTGEGSRDMSNRFVSSTGQQVVDVDKHMVSYIESQIAKQHQVHHDTASISKSRIADSLTERSAEPGPGSVVHREDARPSTTYQLSEVEIKPTPPQPEKASRQPPRKPRLGRDGKPFRPRPRKRRNSEDVARDALVESVLHERKLENVYQSPIPTYGPGPRSEGDDDGPGEHDEVFAEKFRQEFMDQVAERKQVQQMKQKAAGAGADKVHGPKLGGSRSARAKMMQQQQQGQSGGKG